MSRPKLSLDPAIMAAIERASKEMREGPAWERDVQKQNAAIDRKVAARLEDRPPTRSDER